MSTCNSDCRDINGITIGLIDTIINSCRLLRNRDLSNSNIIEALKDLKNDEDFKYLIDVINKVK